MSTQLSSEPAAAATTVAVDCTVSVSRDADGDLTDGVRARLASADGVHAVETVEVSGLRPGLNDLTVEVHATLSGDADLDAATLASTFGVCDVTVEWQKGPPEHG